jgi:hypothetical protein
MTNVVPGLFPPDAFERRLQQLEHVLEDNLKSGGGGGTSGGMEARVAKLEAHMEHVRGELAKLAQMPVEIAAIKERQGHLPTKDEARKMLDDGIERLGSRVQRAVTIVGGAVTLLLGLLAVALKFWIP